MFKGEEASLDAILKTGTLKVPKPLKVVFISGQLTNTCADQRYLQTLEERGGYLLWNT